MKTPIIISILLLVAAVVTFTGCKSKATAPRIPVMGGVQSEVIIFEETAIIPIKEGPEGARKPGKVVK